MPQPVTHAKAAPGLTTPAPCFVWSSRGLWYAQILGTGSPETYTSVDYGDALAQVGYNPALHELRTDDHADCSVQS